jgi:squalene-hopene/tetraprenyl-beta-curcumene cyclase
MSAHGLTSGTSAEVIDRALAIAAGYLSERQSPDGAWRSEVYGVFRNGDALTPLVLHALHAIGGAEDVQRRGAAYLAAMIGPDGTIDAGPCGLTYPAYTAALSVLVLTRPCHAEYQPARDTWLSFLRRRQLTEALGWTPADSAYGGWGYSQDLPRKPAPGEPVPPLTDSNLSATAFALMALRAAGCADDDPALRRALVFVRRCQNVDDDPARRDPAFDDGGFFFMHGDPVRNKAGVAGRDRHGRQRFASYGSTTADGLRSLLACGLPRHHPRVRVALEWLEQPFCASAHPGRFAPGRAAVGASVYFYYCWSVAGALSAAGAAHWAEALAEALLRCQRPDGSWCNRAVEVREDDPVVATSLAAGALALCRTAMRRT